MNQAIVMCSSRFRLFILRLIATLACLTLMSACSTLSRGPQNQYDEARAILEQKARNGEITWVEEETRMRAVDRVLAENQRLVLFGTLAVWKYDSDDDEYHAYCISLAERLDRNEMTFAQFDALRTQRFNNT